MTQKEGNAIKGYYHCKRPKECLYMDMQKYRKTQYCCRKLTELDLTWKQLYCNQDFPVDECKYFKPRNEQSELSMFGE